MTRISGGRSAAVSDPRLDNRRTQGERTEQLELLNKAVAKLGRKVERKPVDLEQETYYCVKLPDGRFIPDFNIEGDDRDVVHGFTGFAVDCDNDQLYINKWGDTYGPFDLPEDFVYQNLFPNTRRDPPARTKGHKVLKSLVKAINDQEPEVFGRPYVNMDYDSDARTWRTPEGGKLHKATPYDKRYSYGTQSMMFDLRKKELWLEQIPGYSGQCKGPYKLPAGFRKDDIAALDKLDHSSVSTTRNSDNYETSSSRRRSSTVIGSDDSDSGYTGPRLRDSIGGGNSPSAPHNVYWSNRGGGGGGS